MPTTADAPCPKGPPQICPFTFVIGPQKSCSFKFGEDFVHFLGFVSFSFALRPVATCGNFATCIVRTRTRSQQFMILKRPSVCFLVESNRSFALRRLRHETNVNGLNSMRSIPAQFDLSTSSVYLSSYNILSPRQIDHSHGIGGGCGLGHTGVASNFAKGPTRYYCLSLLLNMDEAVPSG